MLPGNFGKRRIRNLQMKSFLLISADKGREVSELLEVGSLLDGKYKILNEIGRGGMSVVYLALNERANKTWAVKVVRKDSVNDSEVIRLGLAAETKMLKKLRHPSLPGIVLLPLGILTARTLKKRPTRHTLLPPFLQLLLQPFQFLLLFFLTFKLLVIKPFNPFPAFWLHRVGAENLPCQKSEFQPLFRQSGHDFKAKAFVCKCANYENATRTMLFVGELGLAPKPMAGRRLAVAVRIEAEAFGKAVFLDFAEDALRCLVMLDFILADHHAPLEPDVHAPVLDENLGIAAATRIEQKRERFIAGYAGGITTAAIDGIKVAEQIAKIYKVEF